MSKIVLMFFFLLVTTICNAATNNINVEWSYPGPEPAGGFNFYINDKKIETFPGNLTKAQVTITLVKGMNYATLKAVDSAGVEGPASPPFPFEAPLVQPIILNLSVTE